MLEAFRKISTNPIFKVLFGILVIAFLFSGAGLTRAHFNFDDDSLVKVGRYKITQAMVDKRYDEKVRIMRRMGMDLSDEQLAAKGISKEQELRTMIQDSLIAQEVDHLGIEVGDDAVADRIKSDFMFQTNGTFDREKFNEGMQFSGMTEQQYTAQLRQKLREDILLDTVSAAVPVNDYVAKNQAESANETRDVEIAVIPKSFKAALTEPTDKDLKDFYFDNSYRFQTPESRDITYVVIPKSKDSASYDLTVKIEDELAGGSTLKEIASKLNLKLETKNNLVKTDENFSDVFIQTAFGKDKGQVSDLISDEKKNQYYVVEVNDVRPARIPDLTEVKDKVVEAWKENNANDQNLKYIAKIADELKTSSGSLQNLAASNGYKYQVLKNIKREDTEVYGARLVNTAFDAQPGEVLGSFQNEDGSYKIAKLKTINHATLSEQDQAKFKTAMAEELRVEIMDEYFEGLRKEHSVKVNESAQVKKAKAVAGKPVADASDDLGSVNMVKKPADAEAAAAKAKPAKAK